MKRRQFIKSIITGAAVAGAASAAMGASAETKAPFAGPTLKIDNGRTTLVDPDGRVREFNCRDMSAEGRLTMHVVGDEIVFGVRKFA